MSTDDTIHLIAPSSSEIHLSKYRTGDPSEMTPISNVAISQTGEENRTIDFKEFGLPQDTTCGIIEHSNSKTQKFIRFTFNKDDYNESKENSENEDNDKGGNNDGNNNDNGGDKDDEKNNENNTNSNQNKDENSINNSNNINDNNENENNSNNSNDNSDENSSNEKKDSNGDENIISDNNDKKSDNNEDNTEGNTNKNDDNGESDRNGVNDDNDEDNTEGNANRSDDNSESDRNGVEDDNDDDDDDEKENNNDNSKDKSCYTKLGKRLCKFITEYWEVEPPEFVLSLVGYSQALPKNTFRNVVTSLKAITRIKGSWSIGQAVDYSDDVSANGEGNKDNRNLCIGFVDGEYIDKSRMKPTDDPTKFKFEVESGELNINPNYTHIIIVDGDDESKTLRLQTALSCSVDGSSFIIPVHSKNRELEEISDVSDYSEIVKAADKSNYEITLLLLDHDGKDERILTYASRSRWDILAREDDKKDKDKVLENMIMDLYKKEDKDKDEEVYKDRVKETYKQTVKILRNFEQGEMVSTKSDHIFQNEILEEMQYGKMFQSVCLAMAWEMEDAPLWIDRYYEEEYEYEKGDDEKKNEKKIEKLRHDMLLASLLNGKSKYVQHAVKVFGIPNKLTKRFLEDLYNASTLVLEPCVDWQEYDEAEHSVDMKDIFVVKCEGESDGDSCGATGRGNNDISGGGCTYSTGDVYDTCLRSFAEYRKLKDIIADEENMSNSVTKGEENPSKARLRWAKLREVFLSKNKTFPKSIIDDTNPTKALFKWAVLHGLDDIALQLSQTSNNFNHQMEMLLTGVAIIFRLRRNAQELKNGEEVCNKRLQRYSSICRVFMAASYDEGMKVDVDDDNVRLALENREVFGQDFVEDFASSEAVQESIQEKWKGNKDDSSNKRLQYPVYTYCDTPQMKFYVHSIFYFVFLTFLSYLAVIEMPAKPRKSPTSPLDPYFESPMCIFCAVYSLLYVFSYIGMEIKQFCNIMESFKDDRWSGVKSYLNNKWNVLDWLCILCFIVVIPLVTTSYTNEVGRVVLAVDVSFWILRILQILKYLEKTGMWIEMLWKMFLDMLKFLIILVIFLFAFGIAMMAMKYPGTDFFESVVKKPYFTIYGEYFLEDLEKVKDPLVRPISIVYVGVYLLVANTLVLNVLIAVFNDSYNDVKAKGTKIWKLSRYDLLQEYRTRPILPPPFTIFEFVIKVIYNGRYLCTPTKNDKEDDAIDELLTQNSWMDKKTKKDDKRIKASPGRERKTLDDDRSDNAVAQRCLSLAIEQTPDDPSYISNYEVKAQLIKKMDEQQKRSDEQKKESNDEFKDQIEKRLKEQLKEANEKLERRLEEQLKEVNEKLEKKLMNKFNILLKHLQVEPVTDEQ